MAEHTEETSGGTTPVPARIQLDDFIEAVSRGVFRAMQAEEEVAGYGGPKAGVAGPQAIIQRPTVIGIWFDRTGGLPGGGVPGLPDSVQGGGVPGIR